MVATQTKVMMSFYVAWLREIQVRLIRIRIGLKMANNGTNKKEKE